MAPAWRWAGACWRSNSKVNVFHRGFKACDSYANAENAIAQVTCPVLFVLGALDQMTQAKAAQPLVDKARATGKTACPWATTR
jgi:alpha-beta hydrolase superfamily lysophospholipase